MIELELFKFNTLISIPLFGLIAYLLIRDNPNYSYKEYTISKSVYFFTTAFQQRIFRINFILKSLLDIGFAVFVADHFHIPILSLVFIMLLLSAFLFASLAYFTEGKYSDIHGLITYLGGFLWVAANLCIAKTIGGTFLVYSSILLVLPLILAFIFLFKKLTNVFVQALCMGIWYVWLLIFVFGYL